MSQQGKWDMLDMGSDHPEHVGIFIDGQDVIEARKLFLRKMTKIGFLHFTNAPTEDAMKALPDVDGPTNERRSKTVVFFHDETTFMSNED